MGIIERFCRTDFSSYEDFFANFTIRVPENFNFTYDVIDEWAALEPEKKALVWCNDLGDERTFTFTDISVLSRKAASAFYKLGLRRGDTVMLMVKRRWEFWVIVPALCRLGVTVIPATFLLTAKDIAYRAELASIKMLITVPDDGICANVDDGLARYGKPCMKGTVGGTHDGYLDVDALIAVDQEEVDVLDAGPDGVALDVLDDGEQVLALQVDVDQGVLVAAQGETGGVLLEEDVAGLGAVPVDDGGALAVAAGLAGRALAGAGADGGLEGDGVGHLGLLGRRGGPRASVVRRGATTRGTLRCHHVDHGCTRSRVSLAGVSGQQYGTPPRAGQAGAGEAGHPGRQQRGVGRRPRPSA